MTLFSKEQGPSARQPVSIVDGLGRFIISLLAQIKPKAYKNECQPYLDFVALGRKGLLDGLVEVAPGVDDEEILRHFRSSFLTGRKK